MGLRTHPLTRVYWTNMAPKSGSGAIQTSLRHRCGSKLSQEMSTYVEGVDCETRSYTLTTTSEAAGLFEDTFAKFTAIDLRKADWSGALCFRCRVDHHRLESRRDGEEAFLLHRMARQGFFAQSDARTNSPLYTIFQVSSACRILNTTRSSHILAQDLDADWVAARTRALNLDIRCFCCAALTANNCVPPRQPPERSELLAVPIQVG